MSNSALSAAGTATPVASPAGIAAAKSAGMRVVAFTGGSHARSPQHRAALLSLEPDALFDDMRELLQFVREDEDGGKEH